MEDRWIRVRTTPPVEEAMLSTGGALPAAAARAHRLEDPCRASVLTDD